MSDLLNRHIIASDPLNEPLFKPAAHISSYEEQLAKDPRWALSEGSKFFEEKSAVQDAMRKITKRLDELGIPYAVTGALALFRHGYRRFTNDVDILVTRQGLSEIHKRLEGLGYLPPFTGSKNLKDTDTGVKIDFIVEGEYPGDGLPKPVAFPAPASVSMECEGIKYVNLPALVEMKIASGMTKPDRIRDLGDVQELINTLNLSQDFASQLNPYVREKYIELWKTINMARKRYMQIWRNKFLTLDAQSLDDMIEKLQEAVDLLKTMR
ncbi:MAG: hypothetical protein ABSG67_06435, partial [Thermoguttaceae bacterium]